MLLNEDGLLLLPAAEGWDEENPNGRVPLSVAPSPAGEDRMRGQPLCSASTDRAVRDERLRVARVEYPKALSCDRDVAMRTTVSPKPEDANYENVRSSSPAIHSHHHLRSPGCRCRRRHGAARTGRPALLSRSWPSSWPWVWASVWSSPPSQPLRPAPFSPLRLRLLEVRLRPQKALLPALVWLLLSPAPVILLWV